MQRSEKSPAGNRIQLPPQATKTDPAHSSGWPAHNNPPGPSPPGSPISATGRRGTGDGFPLIAGFLSPGPANAGANPKRPLPPKPRHGQTQTEDAKFLRGIGRGAHVWTTYVKETKEFDDGMVEGWNKFVIESAKLLKPDSSEQTVIILKEVLKTLQGNQVGQPLTTPSLAADEDFQPTRRAVWVNCLWYLSLSIGVAVTLAAMLAKQWCYHYLAARSGDTITQAEERQKRYNGLRKWRMQTILEQLPMMIHVSLGM
ncbi:hypothetical protein FRC07_004241 [Ceratobasidium sp. 392]|nr:hypothetical protein FRC07_004241 [Ceratobasidium sp. 392]